MKKISNVLFALALGLAFGVAVHGVPNQEPGVLTMANCNGWSTWTRGYVPDLCNKTAYLFKIAGQAVSVVPNHLTVKPFSGKALDVQALQGGEDNVNMVLQPAPESRLQ